ncbi:TetR family transcriptional regulator C-terminal domain-containing protein [Kitasatospora sp. NPDC086009]|uniref:TetR family transcriptional regulator C-terminal domain-containing protein n=1 Tax=unclassified Kitasatospora TaxID=2633591 RepID=UPI0037C88A55
MTKKEALTRAAAELLWERGYTGTSPAKVLERAQAGQGSMYHHFSGKAELALAAMARMSEELRTRAETALGAEGGAVDRVNAFLDLERDPLAGCRMGRLTQDYDIVTDERLRAPLAEFFGWLDERLTSVLAEGVRTGELRPGTDPAATASLVMAAVQGGYVLARAQQRPAAFDRTVEGLRRVLADLRTDSGEN